MKVHLVDGTWELFRAYFGAPSRIAADGREVGATCGMLRSLLALLRDDSVTHLAVAFDHVVESFRNELYDGYKTGEGIEPELYAQFTLAEQAAAALGLTVWPMVQFEADDALASGAARFAEESSVEQVVLCTPDKDLTQCVRGQRVVCFDRLRERLRDEAEVVAQFGVPPLTIPDYLALVGDSADGIPGVPRWGAKSSATVLARYGHLEQIPDDEASWDVKVRGATGLARSLREHRSDAELFKTLTTLRTDVPLDESLGDLAWRGARRALLEPLCEQLDEPNLASRVPRWQD